MVTRATYHHNQGSRYWGGLSWSSPQRDLSCWGKAQWMWWRRTCGCRYCWIDGETRACGSERRRRRERKKWPWECISDESPIETLAMPVGNSAGLIGSSQGTDYFQGVSLVTYFPCWSSHVFCYSFFFFLFNPPRANCGTVSSVILGSVSVSPGNSLTTSSSSTSTMS